MRGLRSTLVLLVVALGLGAYIYFVERHRPAASETEPNETLFTFDAEDVAELHVTAENGAVTELQRADGSWQVVAPVETAGDDNAASSIASTLASLEIRRVVEEGPADLEPFGLDEPALDVGFTLTESDTKQHLLIGDQTPTGTDRYAKLAAQDRVFLIAGYLDTTFDKTTFDLRDKTILEFKRDDLDGLEITNAGQTLRFTKDGDDWLVSEPWNVPADFSTVEGLIGSLSFGTMQAVEAESAEDLEPFGLADPTLTVAVTAGSATATLLVGHEAQDGTRYARDESRSLVFTVAASLASDLERDAGEYRRKDLFRFRPVQRTLARGRASRGNGRLSRRPLRPRTMRKIDGHGSSLNLPMSREPRWMTYWPSYLTFVPGRLWSRDQMPDCVTTTRWRPSEYVLVMTTSRSTSLCGKLTRRRTRSRAMSPAPHRSTPRPSTTRSPR